MRHKLTKQNTSTKVLVLSIAALVVIGSYLGILTYNAATKPYPLASYHGPNPNIKLVPISESNLNGSSVLGTSTSNRFRRNRPTPIPTRIPITTVPTIRPTNVPLPTNNATPSPTTNKHEYGIAAGGGLTSLSQGDLDTYFKALQTLGVEWVRWDIDWGAVQPDNATTYNWSDVDRVAANAQKYGLKSLAIITYTPKWAALSSCAVQYGCAPADPKVFASFAATVATHFKGQINTWEIWNEPNNPSFWHPRPDATAYTEVLKQAYTQIKAVDPSATILSAGLAASGNGPDGSIAPITFITNLYADSGKNYFDAIALHPYSYPASPGYLADWNSWQQMTTIHLLMATNGDSAKKIWVTEYGAPTNGPGATHLLDQLTFTYDSDFMSELAQKDMVQSATNLYVQNASWMGPFFWYSFHDNGTSLSTPENFFGLFRYDWSKKPAYDIFQGMINSGK